MSKADAGTQKRIVADIFSSINKEYDFLNHFLSLGQDILWRRGAVRRMRFFKTYRLLDVATGTADLAIEAAVRNPAIFVNGIDLAEDMMAVGRRKIEKKRLTERIVLQQADALHLPFPDGNFDVASIAFGIRNIPDRLAALREMGRVVQSGGRVIVLEMSLPDEGSPLRGAYAFYLKKALPLLARPFSRNAAAYAYLADSISHFPLTREIFVPDDGGWPQGRRTEALFPRHHLPACRYQAIRPVVHECLGLP